ncbi:MAG: anti-sigma factor [Anaerolineae bacterium]|nr:anti-sigma factor [Anaerolineae bacterium]MDH7475019.1 anti-sigma factor [Anaerolineae bacterium]
MNQRNRLRKDTDPEALNDPLAESPECGQGMAEDHELMDLLQRSLWGALAHQNPPPEVWDRILARLPEQKRERRSAFLVWTWPRLLSNAVVVGLAIAFLGLALWQPLELNRQGVPILPAASQVSYRERWRGKEIQGPVLPRQKAEFMGPVLSASTDGFEAMAGEGLLNEGYLYHLQNAPAHSEVAGRGRSVVATDSVVRYLLP